MAVFSITLTITALVLFITWYFSRRYSKSPPGPIGLPVLGSLLSIKPEAPHHSLTEISKRYGRNGICQLFLGSVRTVLLTDPKLIREAFAKEEFSGRAPLFLTHGIMNGYGMICAEGELWKDQRRLLSSWIRAMGATKTSANRESFESKISRRLDLMEKCLESRSDPDLPMDIQPILADNIGNLISELVHGVSFPEGDETWRWLLHIQEESVKAMGVAAIVNFLPFIRFISSSTRKVMHIISSGQMQTHTIYKSIIDVRRNMKNRKNGENVVDPDEKVRCVHYEFQNNASPKVHYFSPKDLVVYEEDCILDLYLDEQTKRVSDDPDGEGTKRLSDTQLLFLLADLFGAGLDTTLVTLMWFILFVTVNEDEQEKIRSELQNQCGSQEPSFSDLPNLPYTRAALCETQRIRSVVPLGMPHGCVKDTMLGEYLIKKGSMIVPLQWAVHTDEDAWEDPLQFRPSRFIGSDETFLNPTHFIPFQTGKRMCPGDELARMILFKFSTRLIQRYHLKMVEPAPSLDGIMGLTMGPSHYKLILQPIPKH